MNNYKKHAFLKGQYTPGIQRRMILRLAWKRLRNKRLAVEENKFIGHKIVRIKDVFDD